MQSVVLLTGVTGFVGKVVLYDLLRRAELDIGLVNVLIRSKPSRHGTPQTPAERFASSVARSEIFRQLPAGWESRVRGGVAGLAHGARAILSKIGGKGIPEADRQVLEAMSRIDSTNPDEAISALQTLRQNEGMNTDTASLIDVLIDDLNVRKNDPANPEELGSFSHETHARLIDEATEAINTGQMSDTLARGNPYSPGKTDEAFAEATVKSEPMQVPPSLPRVDDVAAQTIDAARGLMDDPNMVVLDLADGSSKSLKEVFDDADKNNQAYDEIMSCMFRAAK